MGSKDRETDADREVRRVKPCPYISSRVSSGGTLSAVTRPLMPQIQPEERTGHPTPQNTAVTYHNHSEAVNPTILEVTEQNKTKQNKHHQERRGVSGGGG